MEALEKMESEKPDLVLLDIMMPGMNGYEVCGRIRENPIYDDVPVIVVTALHGTQEMVKAIEHGADEFLTKPVSGIELQARVRSLLKKKLLKDQLKSAYRHINDLTDYMNKELTLFTSQTLSKKKAQSNLVLELLARGTDGKSGPTYIMLGKCVEEGIFNGTLYNSRNDVLIEEDVSFSMSDKSGRINELTSSNLAINNCNDQHYNEEECRKTFGNIIVDKIGIIRNFIHYNPPESDDLVLAFNYGMEVTNNDADILKSFLLHSHVFSSLSEQMDEVDRAFRYLVSSLALIAEANDEETGNHIVRVNNYSEVIAEELKLPASFVSDIGFYAQMHDVGKIQIHHDVLNKTETLSDNEFEKIKEHTFLGSRILGDEPRL
ncbi:MAG: response regulator, partial [Proteobacteria bacterium]|nr:response regulator [Pseudomonadota bacterium]